MLWWKIGGALALIAGLWLGVRWFNGVLAERDELRVTTAQQSDTIARFEQHAKDETESAARLRTVVEKIDGVTATIQEQIKSKPLTRPVTHEVKDNAGNTQTFTCNERDADRYFRLFNAAVTGRADATAAGVPDSVPSQ